jgi:hypothetical protein
MFFLKRHLLLSAIIIFAIFYAINFRTTAIGDSQAHFYQALSIVYSGDYSLDEYESQLRQANGGKLPYFVIRYSKHLVSVFNFVPALLLVPFFAVGRFLYGSAFQQNLILWGLVGKFAASLLIFFSGIFLWKLLNKRVQRPVAILAVIVFWFGSPLWGSSIDYLQHNPLIFFKFAAFYTLFRSEDSEQPKLFLGGLLLALAVLSRYQNLFPVFMIACWILWLHRGNKNIFLFILGGLLPLPFTLYYQYYAFGSPFKQYVYPLIKFNAPLFKTVKLILLNPNKGIFIHSPWVLLTAVPIAAAAGRKERQFRDIAVACILSIIPALIIYGKLNCWFGGWTWGYRYMLDVLPEIILLFAFGASILWKYTMGRWTVGVLVALSICVQTIGALAYDHEWHSIHDLGYVEHCEWIEQRRNSQIVFSALRGQIYIGQKPVQLFPNPYKPQGIYGPSEKWGNDEIVWAGGKAHFLYVAHTDRPKLEIFPSPAASLKQPIEITITTQNGHTVKVQLPPSVWSQIPLPVPFQYSSLIDVEVNRTHTEKSAATSRELGVAIKASQIAYR